MRDESTRSWTVGRLAALALGVAAVALPGFGRAQPPPASVTEAVAEDVTIEGFFSVIVEDSFETGTSLTRARLLVEDATYALAGLEPGFEPLSGTIVRVHGRRAGDTITVTRVEPLGKPE